LYPGKHYEDWEVADPDGQPIELVRAIRDDIAQRVQALVDAHVPAANV
jgi:arsenate reductase (thioredoxin)